MTAAKKNHLKLYNQVRRVQNSHFRRDGDTWVADKSLIDSYLANPENPYLISFSRTGSHWLRMLMELYFEKPALTRIFYYGDAQNFTCYHTHDMDLSVQRKHVIYLWRNPVDTIFSQMSYYKEDLEDRSRIKYWAYLYAQHLSKWLLNENQTLNKVVLTYEGMKKNLEEEFTKLCNFFGEKLDLQRLERVAQQVSKEKLKAKNISDKQVIKISDEYEGWRKQFKATYSDYIYDVMLEVNPTLEPLLPTPSKPAPQKLCRYYSQHGEDYILEKIFAGQQNGYFVEIGCIDGKRFSNTLHFAEKGWQGLCVEAHPDYIPMLEENRPESVVVHAAITNQDQSSIKFYANSRGSLSTVDKGQESHFRSKYGDYFTGFEELDVPAMTLGAVLEQHCKGREIDFISLDIEGHEVEALAGHDFEVCKPRLWLVECDTQEHRREIEAFLLPAGYYFLGILGGNAFYSLDRRDADKISSEESVVLTHTQHPCDSDGDKDVHTSIQFINGNQCLSGGADNPGPGGPAKIVGLVAARNEEAVIGQCLQLLSGFTDAIVYLDDCSTDNTLSVVRNLAGQCNIERILTKERWRRDEPGDRNKMLNAGRDIGGTHFIVLDADEAFTSNWLTDDVLRKLILSLRPGDKLLFNWIALWKSTQQYRNDNSVWTHNYQPFVFCDDGKCFYSSEFIHTPRSPRNLSGRPVKIERYDYGVLHFQFVNWHNLLLKQAWYRCLERVREPQKSVTEINKRYARSKDETDLRVQPSNENWLCHYPHFDPRVFDIKDNWRQEQIVGWFNEYGVGFFKDLDIWDIISPITTGQNLVEPHPFLVSAIVSTYNSEEFIRGCLQDLIEQTLYQKGQLEIVVVNSASEENEDAIIREYADSYPNIKYIRTDQRETVYAAWNRGIRASAGQYITNANTDDRHAPEMLEKLVRMLENTPDVAVVYSHFYITSVPNQTWQNRTPERVADWHPPYSRQALLKACFTGPQPVWRRSLHDEYGWFDDALKVAGDYEFFMRVSQTYNFILNKEPVGLYYHNPGSLQRSAGTWEAEDTWVKQLYGRNWGTVIRLPFEPTTDEQFMPQAMTLEIPSLHEALRCFQLAQREYETGNMLTARKLIQHYQALMDYNQLNSVLAKPLKTQPLFSVILVTYNRPDDVRRCIQSLKQQVFDNYEIIVVDNGLAGQKAGVLAGNVDVYVDCPINFNPSEGRNIGAHFAQGEILVFLDDDALVGPDYLESIRKAFEQYEILGLRGRILPKNAQKRSDSVTIYDLGENPCCSFAVIEGNAAFRRDAYLAVGEMDALLFGHEGIDLSYQLMRCFDRPSAVIYWPDTIIYHDYGDSDKTNEKENRYTYNRNYIRHKYDTDVVGLREKIEKVGMRANRSGQLLPQLPVVQPPAQTEPATITSKTNGPKVSIVMSCHNAAEFLPKTMDTIFSQTLKEWELVVTDDGSTDATRQMLETYAAKDQRIRLRFFDDQKGPYVRRNYAIEQAKAPFICIQDADDLMAANKLEILYEEINRDERLGIVGSFYRRFLDTFRGADFGDRMEKRITHEELMEAFPGCWHLCWHGSAIIRKSLFETIGLYDEQPYGSDTFWLSKAGLYGLLTGQVRFKNLPEFLTYKREHAQSQTGKISPVDPRSRRHCLERYYLQKLQKISEESRANPSMDVAQRIRECRCTDFIPKFGHLFDQWESVPVNNTMTQGLINRGLSQFAEEQYVSALITLNCLDQMVSGGCQSYRNLNLTRGLAYYASGDDEQASANIRKEIQLFQNQNAGIFSARYLGEGNIGISAVDRRANIRRFVAEASQNMTSGTSLTPPQSQLTDPSADLQERLALAKQYLHRGKSEEALCVYRGLLSDNKLAGQIELKDKLKKLVEGIRLAKISQVSTRTGFNVTGSGNN